MEEAQKIAREVQESFSKTIDAQCDQPLNVAAAFEAVKKSVKTTSQKIVRDAIEKMLGAVTTNMDGIIDDEKNKICTVIQGHLEYSKKQCEYLYTCKSGISATLYIDASLTL
jgi:hypothetical protein